MWNPWAVPDLAAGAILVAAAGFVFAVAPARRLNRLLALVFFLEGLGIGALGLMYSTDVLADAWAFQIVLSAAVAPVPFVYARFLGHALPGPGPRFLRGRVAGVLLAAAALAAVVAPVAFPSAIAYDPYVPSYAPVEFVPGPLLLGILSTFGIVGLVAIALSASAFLRAPRGDMQRRRAGFFLAAFGLSDLAYVALFFVIPLGSFSPDSAVYAVANVAGFSVPMATTAVLVGYGILRYQLFDLDVRLKVGVRHSTVAAAFLAVFFVVAQLVEAYAGRFGTVAGALAAGLLLFALRPLQSAAERVADTAMPRVRGGDVDYVAYRKIEVYKATVEEVAADGRVTDDERRLLARLAAKLDLGETAARAIERDVFTAKGVA